MAEYSEQTFYMRNKPHKGGRMPVAHFHDQHELYYLESGSNKYFIGNEIILLSPGEFAFVPRGAFHLTDSEVCPNVARTLFTFGDDFPPGPYQACIDELSAHKHFFLPKEHRPALLSLIQRIESELSCRDAVHDEMLHLYLCQLLLFIARYAQRKTDAHYSPSCQIVQDAVLYISTNLQQPLTLKTLSSRYSISPGYFSKLFKQVTGTGLSEYINIARITAAQELLKTSDQPITKIAYQCGFNDSNYFANVFRKLIGMTPKKYAMQFRQL